VFLQPITPLIVELSEPATEEISVGDLLGGVFSFAGWMIVVAIVLAVLFAAGLIWLRNSHPSNPLSGGETDQTKLGLHLP